MAVTLNANSSTGFIATSDTSGVLQLQTGGTTAVTVDASQNVGIGTASPTTRLHVDSGSAGLMLTLNSTNANGGYITGRSSGTGVWDIGTSVQALAVGSSTDMGINVRTGFLAFGTATVERMRINAGAPILCLSGGNTSATGTGIAFPATQSASTDANTLDDYEEGTFTATITGMGSATNNNVTARYIKIGRVVTLYFPYTAYTTNAGSGASDVAVALPFPASSTGATSAALGLQSGGSATGSKHTNLYFSSGGSTALFYYDEATAWTRVTGSLLASTWNWAGNVVYLTDS
jgi:hypothetical protein